MTDFEDFIEFVDYVNSRAFIVPSTGIRRYLRDYSNPFEKYSEEEFLLKFRLTQNVVLNTLLPMVAPELKKPSRRGLPFAPEVMLLLTLRFFATGSSHSQKMEVDSLDVCQQSASRIIAKVSQLIALKMETVVKLPSTTEEISSVKRKFYKIAKLPEVIGCIDCTHIKIKNPGGNISDSYRNKEGWFSLKVQAVVGPNLEFFDIVAHWPGSTTNSTIYNKSLVEKMSTGELQGIFLGDSKYEVTNTLLTPFLSPSSTAEEAYNQSHIETRRVARQAIEEWKNRFPCLYVGLGVKLETSIAVISACATLHNICRQLDEKPFSKSVDVIFPEPDDIGPVQENLSSDGFVNRQVFVERNFL